MNDPQAIPRQRSSRPTGELPDAIREWADWNYMMGKILAQRCVSAPPGHDPKDWRSQMDMRSRRLVEVAVKLGIWEPDMSDGGE